EGLPAIAGGSPEGDAAARPVGSRGTHCLLILVPTTIAAAATVVFGIYPDPLVDFASNAGESLAPLL
ncbi:MAG: hypothetical protein ACRDL3_05575, partial [Solirubrobacterales bacterium]